MSSAGKMSVSDTGKVVSDKVCQEFSGMACILGRNNIGLCQHPQGAGGNVFKVTYGCGYYKELPLQELNRLFKLGEYGYMSHLFFYYLFHMRPVRFSHCGLHAGKE